MAGCLKASSKASSSPLCSLNSLHCAYGSLSPCFHKGGCRLGQASQMKRTQRLPGPLRLPRGGGSTGELPAYFQRKFGGE